MSPQNLPIRIMPYTEEFNKLSKQAQEIVLNYGDDFSEVESKLQKQLDIVTKVGESLPMFEEFKKVSKVLAETISFYQTIRMLYLNASSSPPKPEPVIKENITGLNTTGLPAYIIPHVKKFNELRTYSQTIILEYGNDIEQAKRRIEWKCNELYEAGWDRQDASISRQLSFYNDALDFLNSIRY